MSTSTGKIVPVALSVLLLAAVAAVPLVWSEGARGEAVASGEPGVESTSAAVTSTTPFTVADAPAIDYDEDQASAQASFLRLSDGYHVGTATERQARPALSLAKLYIAEYVLEHGTSEEAYEALSMISSSDDSTAEELYEKYPDSIDVVASHYQLYSTRGGNEWGRSRTSTYDVVRFVAELMAKDPRHPVLVAMALADPVASDGYGQDFGTSTLPGARGTKWGWSDDRDLHSSVTFGDGWVAAAALSGDADDLTDYVDAQLTGYVDETEE